MLRKIQSFIVFFIVLVTSVPTFAQAIRLSHVWSHTNISIDLNQLYNYNVYERHRWGGGIYVLHPLKYDTRYGTDFQNSLYAEAGAAWGTGDHAWKYHGIAELRFPRYSFRKIGLAYYHDLEMAGTHSFSEYNILNTYDNSSYFSSHYSFIDRLRAQAKFDLPGKCDLDVEYRHSSERLLFNAYGLLFPSIDATDALPKSRYDEALLTLQWGDYYTANLQCGIADNSKAVERGMVDGSEERNEYARVVLQYKRNFKLGKHNSPLSIYAQAGSTLSDHTPISRRFDLGGTGGTYYWFRNTFLTVPSNSLMADVYLQLFLTIATGRPLWDLPLSKPRPFVRLAAQWGTLYGEDVVGGTGLYNLLSGHPSSTYSINDIELVAPCKGLFEPAVGIDHLLHWGIFDLGIAAALQITPKNVIYHSHNFFDNFAVMCVAKLVFDN